MHKKRPMRTISLITILCLILSSGALAAVLGDLIDGYQTFLGAGMELSKGVYWTGSDFQTENYIEYTPSKAIRPVVVSGSKVCNYGNFSSMAALLEKEGKHVIAGINGDYYVVANYEPLGIVVQDGKLLSSDAGHWGVGFTDDGNAVFGKPELKISINIGGTEYTLDSVNKTRRNGGAAFYTDDYAYATKNTGNGTDIIFTIDGPLSLNCSRTLTAEKMITTGGAVNIPSGKAVLSVSENATDELKSAISTLTEGTTATLKISSPSEWTNVSYAIGSLYKLITNGKVLSGLPDGTAPRTAVGKKADGSVVFYTVDGRQPGHSIGTTMKTLAERMLELGCVEASIMDGGGSTSMNAIYLGNSSVSQINSPSDKTQRSVTNYIMLITEEKPIGTASRLALYPLSTNILSGATSTFTFKGADDNGYAASLNKSVSLSVSDGLGSINLDGTFKASGEGRGNVIAEAEGMTGASVQINVVASPDTIIVKNESTGKALNSLTVSSGSTTLLTAEAKKNHVTLISQDTCYTWSAEGEIGTISEDGTFIATNKNANGTIIVKAGTKTISIPVTVTNPEKFDDVSKTDWYYDAVKFVSDKGAMSGTADRTFSPNIPITRAMVVTILHRLENSPNPDSVNIRFTDVQEGQWFTNAVYWANSKGIVQGYDGRFDPHMPITREQLATILYRYSLSPETGGSLEKYSDASEVSPWADSAFRWAVETKLISGVSDTQLSPRTTATRAQFAMILYRMENK